MAPKETKRDRERRLKAQEQEATDAPTDGPTDEEEPIQYNAEGVLMRPGTSSADAAAPTASGASAAAAVAIAKVGSLSSSDSESDGVAREKERSVVVPAAKRASRSSSSRSRSKVPKKKAKKSKKARRRRRKESSSSSSSSGRDDRRRGSRGRSPSTSASSSSSDSGDSDWEEFYANDTVIKVRCLLNMLKTAPPRAPRDVAKGRFSFDTSGEVFYVKKADKKGRKEKWMRESRSRRSDCYADYKGSISRLGRSGNDRVL
jgi:hypothetical protein